MRNPKQAATDKVLRELLGIVTKPLVDGYTVEKDKTQPAAPKSEPTPDNNRAGATSKADDVDINQILGTAPMEGKAGDFIEHDRSRGRSLTEIAAQATPRAKSPRKKRKKRGRR